jgi:hypothetical protein
MLATCKLDLFEVDNTRKNRGFPRSVNLGIERMKTDGTDWLIIVASSLRFGPPGGLDLIDHLAEWPGLVCEAQVVFGWHLIAFRREVIETVGWWDTNFSPYGYDDIDYSVRFQSAYDRKIGEALWSKAPVDVSDAMMGHGIKLAGVNAGNEEELRRYFFDKWGFWPGDNEGEKAGRYSHPFNDPNNPVSYFPGTP